MSTGQIYINQKTFFIETWGCQMNEEDSEKLSGMLKNIGYVRTTENLGCLGN